ncbi:hypothetical protein AB0P02_01190 [Streptomyces griseoluteus]|uniref:hypothetical protein n=1 Tax=Streptomyces griseoluteus TaxID=29306 RepID=UPI0034343E8F
MPTTLRAVGADKDLTLDELADFVKAARDAGVPGDNVLRAALSTTGKIKEVETSLSRDDR